MELPLQPMCIIGNFREIMTVSILVLMELPLQQAKGLKL